jgi:hypothetical protein
MNDDGVQKLYDVSTIYNVYYYNVLCYIQYYIYVYKLLVIFSIS